MSAIFIPNEDLRRKVGEVIDKRVLYIAPLFGAVGFEAAYKYKECEDYLEQLIDYLWDNYLFLDDYLKKYMPRIKC